MEGASRDRHRGRSEDAELHQRRWVAAGQPGAFASARFAGFHRSLIPRLLPGGSVFLFRVRAGGKTVGCLYNFVERRRVLFYQSGLAAFEDRRISPGFTTFALCMEACLQRGLLEYNFLADDSQYKRELSTAGQELVWATARRRRLKLFLLDELRAVRRTARRASATLLHR